MSFDQGAVYMIRDRAVDDSDDWVSPVPASDIITDAVVEATDLTADDIDDLDTYVDSTALRAVISGPEESITFAVNGYDVTVSGDGTVEVDA